MQLDTIIIGVLFPTIPLMIIDFGDRYSLLTRLIGNFHHAVINKKNLNR